MLLKLPLILRIKNSLSSIRQGFENKPSVCEPTTELKFSRDNVVAFAPGGMASTREWIQIDRADAADYVQDLPLFQASAEFVGGSRTR